MATGTAQAEVDGSCGRLQVGICPHAVPKCATLTGALAHTQLVPSE